MRINDKLVKNAIIGVAGEDVAMVAQQAQRGLGVHAVLVAAKGNHSYFEG